MAVRWKCPICKKDTEPLSKWFPFCSDRCRVLDLANWADEKYVISRPASSEELRPRPAGDEDADDL
jgi:endogenous inhibitor of DNA gyrase (YacG/DUF329 family)